MKTGELADRVRSRARELELELPAKASEQLVQYLDLLARWNRRLNLTSLPVDHPTDAALDRLLLEPVAAARYVSESPLIWYDIGSGGGSPAVPLKLLRPQADLVMVESAAKKCAFLREVVRELGLASASVENTRFEALSQSPGVDPADLVTIRAVRLDAELVAAAKRTLNAGGRLLFFGPPVPPVGNVFQQRSVHLFLNAQLQILS